VTNVRYDKNGPIARITLSRPDAMNAINRAMNAELWEVWRDFDNDPELRVAILTGAGNKAFCAGADLDDYIPDFLGQDARRVRENVRTGLGAITRGLHRIYKPIIGAINGWALAGGFELALACDLRVASTNAVFGSYEIHRGFHHGDGGIVRLLASVGLARTFEFVLTGRDIGAEEAARIGLVGEIVPFDELQATADRYAEAIAKRSPVALRSAKETILEVVGRSLDDALRLEALYGYSSGDSDDVRRRLEVFRERGQKQP
jgi:enoyl-CoA hydratase/carnithine racemase